MSDLSDFLAEQYKLELGAFRSVLDAISEENFAVATGAQSAAWQALHIADWLRLGVLGDRSPTYGYLGWEDQAWAQALNVNPPLTEAAGRVAVLARLDEVAAQVHTFLSTLSEVDLKGTTFSPSAPNGERPRLQALGLHVRHVAYHRGQLALLRKELQ